MKYIINEEIISNFPVYKNYKLFSKLTEDEKKLVDKRNRKYSISYYCIENNEIIDCVLESKDFKLADNCRVMTEEEIYKYELDYLISNTINSLNKKYQEIKNDIVLVYKESKEIRNLDELVILLNEKRRMIPEIINNESLLSLNEEMAKINGQICFLCRINGFKIPLSEERLIQFDIILQGIRAKYFNIIKDTIALIKKSSSKEEIKKIDTNIVFEKEINIENFIDGTYN